MIAAPAPNLQLRLPGMLVLCFGAAHEVMPTVAGLAEARGLFSPGDLLLCVADAPAPLVVRAADRARLAAAVAPYSPQPPEPGPEAS